MVFVLNQNKKGLWLLNKKCVIIDNFLIGLSKFITVIVKHARCLNVTWANMQAARVNF